MNSPPPGGLTPVYLKPEPDWPWPGDEPMFYLLSRDGLFLCRNHPFFRSCVPARRFPGELAKQQPFLQLHYPRIPRSLVEQVVGFFDIIGMRHHAEAAALVVWNQHTRAVEILVPPQVAVVGGTNRGGAYLLEVYYEIPVLPPHRRLMGDIHSHVHLPAFASFQDRADETHSPGLHLVVGHIEDEPPQFHCEVVADGMRFRVSDLTLVLEGYERRRIAEVPAEWIEQVQVESAPPARSKGRWPAGQGSAVAGTTPSATDTARDSHTVSAPAECEALAPGGNGDIPGANPARLAPGPWPPNGASHRAPSTPSA